MKRKFLKTTYAEERSVHTIIFLFVLYMMQFKRRLAGRQVSLLSMFLNVPRGRTPGGQKIIVLNEFFMKKIKKYY